ncbi:MAG: hypothetical protein JSW27_17290 [Phycisphaerales bacterium]|nr:MAG: hypothetical protein JSW27_17290 [Phycisphaerales bacterium]
MRWYGVLAVCLVCGLSVGCQENLHESQSDRNLDVELVNTLNNLGVENAIVAQHTLYPYHFVLDAEELNELGRRDLSVLARHFREHEGTLNVRRGKTSPELYEARLTYVIEELTEAGVDTDRMVVADGMPGGDGMASERVVTIMEKSVAARSSGETASYSGTLTR